MYEVELTPKDVKISAIKWTGFNFASVLHWALQRGATIELFQVDDKEMKIYNHLEKQWTLIPVGHYILCGLQGEFYPFEENAMRQKYNVKEV